MTSIEDTLHWLLREVPPPCEASIIGGNMPDQNVIDSVIMPQLVMIKRVLEKEKVKIKEWDVLNTPYVGRAVIIDKSTGEVFNLANGQRTRKKERNVKASLMDNWMLIQHAVSGGMAVPINRR